MELTQYEAGTISIIQGTNLVQGFGTRWLTYVNVNDTITIKNINYNISEVRATNEILIDSLYPYSDVAEDEYLITINALLDFTTSNTLSATEIIANGTDLATFGPNLPNPTTALISFIAEQSDDDITMAITDGSLDFTISYPDTVTVTLSAYGYEDYTFNVISDVTIIPTLSTVNVAVNDVAVTVFDYQFIDLETVSTNMFDATITDNIAVIDPMTIYIGNTKIIDIKEGGVTIEVDTQSIITTSNDHTASLITFMDTSSTAVTMNEVEVALFNFIDINTVTVTANDIFLKEDWGIDIDLLEITVNNQAINEAEAILMDLNTILVSENDVTIIGS